MKPENLVYATWCPLYKTQLEGYCVDHVATVRYKSKKCKHRMDCAEKLKKASEENKHNES